jgi:hypothetical protein
MIQNLMTDVLIRAGSTFLPTVVAGLSALAEKVPQVFEALGQLYVKHLEGPLTQLRAALTVIGTALGTILFDWGGGGAGESVGGVFTVIATAVGALATQLAVVVDVMGDLLSNPVMQGLGKMVVLLGAATIALKGLTALRGMFASLGASMLGLGRGVASTLTFGRMGAAGTSADPAAAMNQTAATKQLTAAEMQLRAAAMETGGAARGAVPAWWGGMGGRYPLELPRPAPTVAATPARPTGAPIPGIVRLPGGGLSQPLNIIGAKMASEALAMSINDPAKMAPVAKTLLQRITGGLTGALATGARTIGSIASTGLSLVSKVFWPLFVADLVLNLAAAPIGAYIRRTTGWKRMADQWSKGWVEGLGALIETMRVGDDIFVGRQPEYRLGKDSSISTATLQSLAGGDPANRTEIGKLMDAVEASEGDFELMARVADMSRWIRKQVRSLPKPDTSALSAGIDDASLQDLTKVIDAEFANIVAGRREHAVWQRLIDLAATLPDAASLQVPDAGELDRQLAAGEIYPDDYARVFSEWAGRVVESARASAKDADGAQKWFNYAVGLIDDAERIGLTMDESLRKSIEGQSTVTGSIPTDDMLTAIEDLAQRRVKRLDDMGIEAERLYRDAIIQSAKAMGIDIPGYQLAGLTPAVLDKVGEMLQHQLPAGLEWFRDWNLKRVAGLDTKPYGVGDTPAQMAGIEGRQTDIIGLGNWRRQQRETIGADQWAGAQTWMDLYGKRIEDAEYGTDKDRAGVIFDVTGKTINPANKKAIDREWKLVGEYLSGMKGLLGIDQREAISQQTQDGLSAAIAMGVDGVSIDPTTWASIGSLLWDGLGDRTEEVGQRIANAVTGWFKAGARGIDWEGIRQEYNQKNKGVDGFVPIPKGKKGGKPDPKLVAYWRQQQIDAVNEAMKNAPGWKPIKAGDWDSFRSMVLSSFVDDLEAADTPKEKKDIQDAVQKLFPGEFLEWPDVVKAIKAPETAWWATQFETMGSTVSDSATNLGTTYGGQIVAGAQDVITATPMGMLNPPKPDIEGSVKAGRAMFAAAQAAARANPITFTVERVRRFVGTTSDSERDGQSGRSVTAGLGAALSAPVPAYAVSAMRAAAAMPMAARGAPRAPMAPSFGPAASRMNAATAGAPQVQQAPAQPPESGQRSQNLFVQQMTVLGPESETGILRTLSFMSPG